MQNCRPGEGSFLVHDDRNMIVHILMYIIQKQCRQDTHSPKQNTDQINSPIALCISLLSRFHYNIKGSLISFYTWDAVQLLNEGGSCKEDSLANICAVGYVQLEGHDGAHVLCQAENKMLNEYVEVDSVTDTAADNANGQSKGRDRAYKVLFKLSDYKLTGDFSEGIGNNVRG